MAPTRRYILTKQFATVVVMVQGHALIVSLLVVILVVIRVVFVMAVVFFLVYGHALSGYWSLRSWS